LVVGRLRYRRAVPATGPRKPRQERTLRPLPPEILSAARRTILTRGVRRTSMGDVAEAAGIPRPTLYEYVANREELIDLVLITRLREIAAQVRSVADNAVSFADAVVETSVAAVLTTRDDPEVANIFTTAPNRQVHQVLEGSNATVAQITAHFLEPMLAHGRRSRELRDDVELEQIIAWIRAVYTAFVVREDADEHEIREMMQTFLLPSLLAARGRRGKATSPRARAPS
jgi:AcrR family transcriptional regulator